MTAPPQDSRLAEQLCGQPTACPAFHLPCPPHCPGLTGQHSSEASVLGIRGSASEPFGASLSPEASGGEPICSWKVES